MEKIKITIDNMSNSAFEEGKEQEIARILRHLADKIEVGDEPRKLLDLNGNAVGDISYDE